MKAWVTIGNVCLIYLQDVGFHMCGSVRICTTPERLEEAKYQMQRHGWQKAPQRLITTEEVAQVHPLLNVDDVLGALYFPGGYSSHEEKHFFRRYLVKNCLSNTQNVRGRVRGRSTFPFFNLSHAHKTSFWYRSGDSPPGQNVSFSNMLGQFIYRYQLLTINWVGHLPSDAA